MLPRSICAVKLLRLLSPNVLRWQRLLRSTQGLRPPVRRIGRGSRSRHRGGQALQPHLPRTLGRSSCLLSLCRPLVLGSCRYLSCSWGRCHQQRIVLGDKLRVRLIRFWELSRGIERKEGEHHNYNKLFDLELGSFHTDTLSRCNPGRSVKYCSSSECTSLQGVGKWKWKMRWGKMKAKTWRKKRYSRHPIRKSLKQNWAVWYVGDLGCHLGVDIHHHHPCIRYNGSMPLEAGRLANKFDDATWRE